MKKNETVTIKSKPTYTVVASVDGCGKTSFIGALVGADETAGNVTAAENIERDIELGESMVQEIAVLDAWTLQMMERAKMQGYVIRLCYICLDTLPEHLTKVENCARLGSSTTSTDEVVLQYTNRWNHIAEALLLCDRAEFYDNSNGFVCVAHYENGRLVFNADSTLQWLDELKKSLWDTHAAVVFIRTRAAQYDADDMKPEYDFSKATGTRNPYVDRLEKLEFETALTEEEIEENFQSVDCFSGIMDGLQEALAHSHEKAAADEQPTKVK